MSDLSDCCKEILQDSMRALVPADNPKLPEQDAGLEYKPSLSEAFGAERMLVPEK